MKSILKVKELKNILEKYKDEDSVWLMITSFDEEGASAELQIRNTKGNVKPIMKDTSGVWGF